MSWKAGEASEDQWFSKRHKARRICSYNFKGGVGKSTTSFNVAAQLADMQKEDKSYYKVLMIDGDPQCNLTAHAQLVGEDVVPDDHGDDGQDGSQEPAAKKARSDNESRGKKTGKKEKITARLDFGNPKSTAEENPIDDEPYADLDLGAFKLGLRDRLCKGKRDSDENGETYGSIPTENTLYRALQPYTGAEAWPTRADCVKPGKVKGFENRLWILQGAPEVARLDNELSSATPNFANKHGKMWACWHHLMTLLEEEYELDFIIIDLSPSASNFNFLAMLSSDYILPSCGIGRYDVASSYQFLTYGLKSAARLGHNILREQLEEDSWEQHAKDDLRAYIRIRKANNETYPSIPIISSSSKLPRMPFVLPFLVQKYKTTGDIKRRERRNTGADAEKKDKQIAEVSMGFTVPYPNKNNPKYIVYVKTRRKMTQPGEKAIKNLQQAVEDAFKEVDTPAQGNIGMGGKQLAVFINNKVRSCYYYFTGTQLTPRSGPGARENIAKNMVIPFIATSEAILALSHTKREPICRLTIEDLSTISVNPGRGKEPNQNWVSKVNELYYLKKKYERLAESLIEARPRA